MPDKRTYPHGDKLRYYQGCRCRECKDAVNAYNRERHWRKRDELLAYRRAKYQPRPRRQALNAYDKFWRDVVVTDEGCWEWAGLTNDNGYGLIPDGRKNLRAHRVSAAIHFGMFDQRLQVCHRCDNPPCANPEHLFLGTRSDNMRDMHNKNRGFAKLTNEQRAEICRRYVKGRGGTCSQLAAEFGITMTHVRTIVKKGTQHGDDQVHDIA